MLPEPQPLSLWSEEATSRRDGPDVTTLPNHPVSLFAVHPFFFPLLWGRHTLVLSTSPRRFIYPPNQGGMIISPSGILYSIVPPVDSFI